MIIERSCKEGATMTMIVSEEDLNIRMLVVRRREEHATFTISAVIDGAVIDVTDRNAVASALSRLKCRVTVTTN